ncbi:MAG: hypothetical protein LBK73_07220 [Treponema sp.]|jgi:hypothetical protein|nr:hypothetical protein [Treponema sp.]
MNIMIIEKEKTARYRTACASPPIGGEGYGFARSIASLIPTANLLHILPTMDFVAQSPYTGCKNAANRRNVRRNAKMNNGGQALRYRRFFLEIVAYAGKQIPCAPSEKRPNKLRRVHSCASSAKLTGGVVK